VVLGGLVGGGRGSDAVGHGGSVGWWRGRLGGDGLWRRKRDPCTMIHEVRHFFAPKSGGGVQQ
jgi:hypothetical protein